MTSESVAPTSEPWLERLGRLSGAFAERYVPDPWIYAISLTLLAMIAAVCVTEHGVWEVARAWHGGFWNNKILTLVAQFSLNLILCTALARTPLLGRGLRALASLPATPRAAIALITLASIALSLISWALCIIGGALFAQEVARQAARRGYALHYPLAIAAGYLGMMTFGLGLTSSAPLIVSAPHHLDALIGVIPFSDTVGSTTSLGILAVVTLICPPLMAAMHPSHAVSCAAASSLAQGDSKQPDTDPDHRPDTFAERLETSPLLLKIAAILPISYFIAHFVIDRKGISIDAMNLSFLCAVLLLYRSPRAMLTQLSQASGGVWSIVFQFPFYAGLMGIIGETGLGAQVAAGFVAVATPETWPTLGIAFSALLNLFVPSAGGQWFATGEILVKTSAGFGFSAAHPVMIEVLGDQLTNMIQPMWALPALALAGLEARHILGYTALAMLAVFLVYCAGLTLFPI